ncbi:hypothetical protein Tco_0309121 [Tanacetum coccineum]
MKIKESLNVTFDETPPPSKTSPLVDDDLDEDCDNCDLVSMCEHSEVNDVKMRGKRNLRNCIMESSFLESLFLIFLTSMCCDDAYLVMPCDSTLARYDKDKVVKVAEKKVLDNDIEDETLEVDEVVIIKESKNHPLGNVIGNLNQRNP